MQQLLLFPETKDQQLERELKSLKDQTDRIRKSQYAKISAMEKKYSEIQHELETLKMALCRCGVNTLTIQ